MKFLLTTCFTLSFLAGCLAQTFGDSDIRITIKGKIVNFETNESISNASISCSINGLYTMSNDRGNFLLKLPATAVKDSILITHIGYQPLSHPVNAGNNNNLVIRLVPVVAVLPDVTVTAINALELLKKAIGRIPVNYPSQPYILSGFYRLTGKKEQQIVHMSESVFDIYNADYARTHKQVKLNRSRFLKDLTAFNGNNSFNFGSTPQDILDFDIVSNLKETGLLNSGQMKSYQLRYHGLINYSGSQAHEIRFDQRDGVKKSLNQGSIIIDANNFAFLEFRTRLSPKGLQYWSLGFSKRMLLNLS
ncbi:MAG: hypothetical protein EOO02_22210, partial [Chitinophagaceae bacterium]